MEWFKVNKGVNKVAFYPQLIFNDLVPFVKNMNIGSGRYYNMCTPLCR